MSDIDDQREVDELRAWDAQQLHECIGARDYLRAALAASQAEVSRLTGELATSNKAGLACADLCGTLAASLERARGLLLELLPVLRMFHQSVAVGLVKDFLSPPTPIATSGAAQEDFVDCQECGGPRAGMLDALVGPGHPSGTCDVCDERRLATPIPVQGTAKEPA